MSSENLVRVGGGLTSATASVLLLLGHILDLGGDPEYGTVLGGSLVLMAHVTLVFAFVALYAAQTGQSGLLGNLEMGLSVVGTTLVSGVVLVEIAGASGADVEAVLSGGVSGTLALLGGLTFFVGLILFGIGTMRAGVFPRWAGLLLIVETWCSVRAASRGQPQRSLRLSARRSPAWRSCGWAYRYCREAALPQCNRAA